MDFLEELIAEPEVPERIANLQLPDPSLMAFYKDSGDRVYYIEDDIDDTTLEIVRVIRRCNAADKDVPTNDRKPIKLFINSSGGDVQVMWSLINAIKLSKTPVYTIVYCIAMSAAAHILAAGHKRYAMPGSTILVHSGSCQFGGDLEKVESAKKYYDALSRSANDLLLAQTKIPAKDLKKKGAVDWYMTSEDALKYGIVDAVVDDIDILI